MLLAPLCAAYVLPLPSKHGVSASQSHSHAIMAVRSESWIRYQQERAQAEAKKAKRNQERARAEGEKRTASDVAKEPLVLKTSALPAISVSASTTSPLCPDSARHPAVFEAMETEVASTPRVIRTTSFETMEADLVGSLTTHFEAMEADLENALRRSLQVTASEGAAPIVHGAHGAGGGASEYVDEAADAAVDAAVTNAAQSISDERSADAFESAVLLCEAHERSLRETPLSSEVPSHRHPQLTPTPCTRPRPIAPAHALHPPKPGTRHRPPTPPSGSQVPASNTPLWLAGPGFAAQRFRC